MLFYERQDHKPVVSTQAKRDICLDVELRRLSGMGDKKVSPLPDDEHACTGQESSDDTESCGSFTNIPSDPSLNSFEYTVEADRISCSDNVEQNTMT